MSTGGREDIERLRFTVRYGDYAGRVWNDLKARFGGSLRGEQATSAISKLREELGVPGSRPLHPKFSSGLEFSSSMNPVA